MFPCGNKKEESEEPNEEMLPRGNKRQNAKTILNADNGTRERLLETFNTSDLPHVG
ncbi:MAG: hypothetical protein KAU62_11945 [Candidatus Heimdallarchaeota archaeon]|nr:hypothetical protein [Candidatus Heimdallarchaeota archaeon]MCK4611859.1 hypothetical protein [Candidatus Heimdallarchaeota archaeon]